MSWNYRVVRISQPKAIAFEEVDLLEIKEVYYDESGNVNGYGDAPVPYGESIEEIKQCLDLMRGALEKPIVHYKLINH